MFALPKRVLLSLTCVFLIVFLCACREGSADISGEWTAEHDCTEEFLNALDADLAQHINFDGGIIMVERLSLNSDGSFVRTLDKEATSKKMSEIKGCFTEALTAYFEEQAGKFDDSFIDMPLDEILKQSGVDVNAIADDCFDIDDISASFGEQKGSYSVKDGVLTFTCEGDNERDAYELSGDVLIITYDTERVIYTVNK